ncbi:MAG: hypothetical protein ACI36V_02735, partial [Coriobacteriales bacterium]
MITRRSMIKIAALGAGSALLNPGIQVAGAEEACSSEDRIALLTSSLRAMVSDFFSRTAWLVMRYGWSG